MYLIPAVVLFIGTIGTIALLGWDTFKNRKPITKAEMQQSPANRSAKPMNQRKSMFKRLIMGEIEIYSSNSWDFNLIFVLIIFETYLFYEVRRAILDNNDDDDDGMIICAAEEHRQKFSNIIFKI